MQPKIKLVAKFPEICPQLKSVQHLVIAWAVLASTSARVLLAIFEYKRFSQSQERA